MTKQRADMYRKATAIQRFSRPITTAFVLGWGEEGKVGEVEVSLSDLPIIPRSRISRESLIMEGLPEGCWQVPPIEVSKAVLGGESPVDSDRESMRIFIRNLVARFGEDAKAPKGSVSVFIWEDNLYVAVT